MEKTGKPVGYEAFSKWERKLARGLARDRAADLGRADLDADDLEQEFLLQIQVKRRASKSATEAGKRAYLRKVLHRRFLDIAKAELREKRAIHGRMDSLDYESETEDGDSISLFETLDENLSPFSRRNTGMDEDRKLMVEVAARRLTESQRRICRLIMDGFNVAEISRDLRKPWSSLKDEIARMRETLYDAGLKDVVGPRDFPNRRRL